MELRKGCKQTEVGAIPEDWTVSLLGELSHCSSGTTPSRSLYERYFRNGVIPWVKTLDLTNAPIGQTSECVTVTALKETSLCLYPIGTVIVAMYGGFHQIGRTGLLRIPATVNQALTAIRPISNALVPEYLLATLNHRVTYWRGVASSSRKDPNITGNDIRRFPIAYPRPHEQRAIAGALSDADAWIESLEQLIAKKRQLKQGAMQELLTGQTRLPGFSGEWERKRLGELASFLSGGTPTRAKEEYWRGKIPWVSASSLRCFEVFRSDSNVTVEAVADGSKMAPIGSTLLLVRGSALHKEILCGLVTQPVCFNQDVKALVPIADVVPRFLTNALRGREQDLLGLVTSAGNTAGVLETKQLKAFEIYVPEPEEQVGISTVLSDMDAEITALESKLAKARQIKQGMMQELLTGRIRLV